MRRPGLGVAVASASTQYLELDFGLITAYPFSLAIWVQTSTTAAQAAMMIGDKDVADDYVRIGSNSSGVAQIAIVTPGGTTADAGATLDDGLPHLLIGVFTDADDRTLYVDDEPPITSSVSRALPAIDRLSIGRIGDSTPSTYWNGVLDEAIVFDDEVTAAEAAVLWNGGAGVAIDRIHEYSAALAAKIQNGYPLDANEPDGVLRDVIGSLPLTNNGATNAPGPVHG